MITAYYNCILNRTLMANFIQFLISAYSTWVRRRMRHVTDMSQICGTLDPPDFSGRYSPIMSCILLRSLPRRFTELLLSWLEQACDFAVPSGRSGSRRIQNPNSEPNRSSETYDISPPKERGLDDSSLCRVNALGAANGFGKWGCC